MSGGCLYSLPTDHRGWERKYYLASVSEHLASFRDLLDYPPRKCPAVLHLIGCKIHVTWKWCPSHSIHQEKLGRCKEPSPQGQNYPATPPAGTREAQSIMQYHHRVISPGHTLTHLSLLRESISSADKIFLLLGVRNLLPHCAFLSDPSVGSACGSYSAWRSQQLAWSQWLAVSGKPLQLPGLWLPAPNLIWVLQYPVQAATAREDNITIYFHKIQKLTFCRVSEGQKGVTFSVPSLFRHQMYGGILSHRCSSAEWYGASFHDRQLSHTKRTKVPMDFLIAHTWEES